MTGMNISGVRPSEREWVPFVLYDTDAADPDGDDFGIAIWGVPLEGGALTRLSHRVNQLSADDIADPECSPADPSLMIACYLRQPSTVNLLDLSAGIPVGSVVCATQSSLLFLSMQPWWHPTDPDLIVYRNVDDSPNEASVRTCQPSVGAPSETILKTVSRSTVGTIALPKFSPSGDYIAYALNPGSGNRDIYVMDDTGAGATVVATLGAVAPQTGWEYAWANNSDVLVYQKIVGGATQIRKVNADGSGDTLLYSDASPWWGITKRPWTADDSAVMFFRRDLGSDPRFRLYNIDAAGGGGAAVSPDRTSYGGVGDDLAYVYGERVYWIESEDTGSDDEVMVSTLPDGSDKRTEFDLSSPPAPFDTLTWIGGFAGPNNA